MRYLATVADGNIQPEFDRFVKSVRVLGAWKDDIIVWGPKDNMVDVPKGCAVVAAEPWWRDSKVTAKNATCLLKADMLSDRRFKNGDQVLYLDCADLVVNDRLKDVFDAYDLKRGAVYARPFSRRTYKDRLPGYVIKSMNLNIDIVHSRQRALNAGVILVVMNKTVRGWISVWTEINRFMPELGDFKGSNKVGDQIGFNYIFRELNSKRRAAYLDRRFNHNVKKKEKNYVIGIDGIVSDYGRPAIIHAPGGGGLPKDIKDYVESL